ncbi:MAG: TetR family transcriptional regulator [Caulobacteraceae bacterium]|nr:TetR family transcriptional regulator [Caulobacteraceae bacterium]
MEAFNERGAAPRAKPRVVKAAALRRLELTDLAQRLFLERGYERTTVNDVIEAAGVSKGAFYHHFRAKEDLLEAIAERFARQSLASVGEVRADPVLNAVQRLNGMLTRMRAWKRETMPELRAMFSALVRPENAVLYYRIVGAVFAAIAPALTEVIEEGRREGVFDVADPALAAEAMISLSEGRRRLTVEAMALADRGDVKGAAGMLAPRLRAEGAMLDRILGLPQGSIALMGSEADLEALLADWSRGQRADQSLDEDVVGDLRERGWAGDFQT